MLIQKQKNAIKFFLKLIEQKNAIIYQIIALKKTGKIVI